MRSMDGYWALVTGGSDGIGYGIAESMSREGAHVVLVARGREKLESAAERLRAGTDREVRTMVADVTDPASVDELFAEVAATVPRLDSMVANVGGGRVVPFLELTVQDWTEVIGLNLISPFLTCQRAALLMRERGGPNRSITVVSSIRAANTKPGRAVYAATKSAANQLVRVMARELAPLDIRVNALLPGITRTALSVANPEAFEEAVGEVPLGRAGAPSDMGAAATYLAGPGGRFVTGVELVVDGGESLVQ